MNLKQEMIDVTEEMRHAILTQEGVVEIPTEDYGWENYRYESPKFRLAHVERYFHNGLLVAHVTCIPRADNPAPIFGFDLVGSEKTGKISGAFVDWSPVLYDQKWHSSYWNSERILPEWATVFSNGFIAIRPEKEERETILDFAAYTFTDYFKELNKTLKTDDKDLLDLIEIKQTRYCRKQASNPRTFAALKQHIGEERAEYFMTKVLFPTP